MKLDRMRLLLEQRAVVASPQHNDVLRRDDKRPHDNQQRRNGACYTCGETGHIARNCVKRQPRASDRPTEAGRPAVTRQVHDADGRRLDRAAYLVMRIRRRDVKCLLDTGSEVCLFPARYAHVNSQGPSAQQLSAANGTAIKIIGEVTVEAELNHRTLTIEGYASTHVNEVILGLGFFEGARGIMELRYRHDNDIWSRIQIDG